MQKEIVYIDQNVIVHEIEDIWSQCDLNDSAQKIIGNQLQRLIERLGGCHYGSPGAIPVSDYSPIIITKGLVHVGFSEKDN